MRAKKYCRISVGYKIQPNFAPIALRPDFIHKISVLLESMSRIELLTY